MRVVFSRNVFRLLGFFSNNNQFILTNGFAKKTQKIPTKEINLAQKRRIEYLERKRANE